MASRRQRDFDYREIAARQFGVVGRGDLLRAGYSTDAIWRRVRAGELEQLRPGAYRIPGSPECWEQDLMAVQVWAGSEMRVSHRSAARLFRLDGFRNDLLEISTPRRLKVSDVVVHQVAELKSYDNTSVGSFRTATVARTLLDLGSVVGIDEVEDALEDALRRRLTTLAALHWELEREGGRGHPGSRTLARLLRVRPRDHVPMASCLEIRIDRTRRRTPLPPYVRQYEVLTRVGTRRPDFAFPEFTVAVEGDGYDQHGGRKRWIYDNERNRALEATGWDVIHVTWDDIEHRNAQFVHDLYTKLIRKGWTSPPRASRLLRQLGPQADHSA